MSEEGEDEVDGWQCCGAEPQDAGDDYLHGQYMVDSIVGIGRNAECKMQLPYAERVEG